MIRADIKDLKSIVSLLSEAFKDNPSVNYIVKKDDKKMNRIRALMSYSFHICDLFGDVWLSDDRKACALVLYPHLKRTTLRTVYLELGLILKAISLSGLKKVMRREKLVIAKKPKIEMAYLWFIGLILRTSIKVLEATYLKRLSRVPKGRGCRFSLRPLQLKICHGIKSLALRSMSNWS